MTMTSNLKNLPLPSSDRANRVSGPWPARGRWMSGAARRLITSALLVVGLLTLQHNALATPGEVPIGGVLREATMKGLNGPARRLSQFKGRPLIINVWASWCGPCRAEMASLERLAWLGHPAGFTIIGISTDDYPDAAKAFMKQANSTISHYIDEKLLLENMLGADKLPLTLLVDANGKVVDKVYGSKQWDGPDAQQYISKAFGVKAGKAATGK
jgi:thiol-disulfide isomerase/thioredoxin